MLSQTSLSWQNRTCHLRPLGQRRFRRVCIFESVNRKVKVKVHVGICSRCQWYKPNRERILSRPHQLSLLSSKPPQEIRPRCPVLQGLVQTGQVTTLPLPAFFQPAAFFMSILIKFSVPMMRVQFVKSLSTMDKTDTSLPGNCTSFTAKSSIRGSLPLWPISGIGGASTSASLWRMSQPLPELLPVTKQTRLKATKPDSFHLNYTHPVSLISLCLI